MDVNVCTSSGIDLVCLNLLFKGEFRNAAFVADVIYKHLSAELCDAVKHSAILAELHMSRTASCRARDVLDMLQGQLCSGVCPGDFRLDESDDVSSEV